ncbi:lysozyme inhibitor LprI family protein [Qipengyuania aurantiaca]|uniref:Lysozyme inhibitor LprI family protein n=1 Tax=Qipengyuania aurantiaca TaxID=2867233 RepID=A0ABX8ZJZ9_9SPHN|nr:lysozyme inhibitor LprI family protein [Qipengyuania aurantiaca]QZD89325.1 lysozyme inhibitor LprI family protein [Qipengyuania aurantiaca]
MKKLSLVIAASALLFGHSAFAKDGVESIFADEQLSVGQQYSQAADYCANDAYPNEFNCAQALSKRAEAQLAMAVRKYEQVAMLVSNEENSKCSADADVEGSPQCNGADIVTDLMESQRAWELYRSHHCSLEARNSLGGWGASANYWLCNARLIGNRLRNLQAIFRFYETQFEVQ